MNIYFQFSFQLPKRSSILFGSLLLVYHLQIVFNMQILIFTDVVIFDFQILSIDADAVKLEEEIRNRYGTEKMWNILCIYRRCILGPLMEEDKDKLD